MSIKCLLDLRSSDQALVTGQTPRAIQQIAGNEFMQLGRNSPLAPHDNGTNHADKHAISMLAETLPKLPGDVKLKV